MKIKRELLREKAWRSSCRDIIDECLKEKDYESFINVCCNPNLTENDINNIYKKHKNSNDCFILGRIGSNEATPIDIYDELFRHENPHILREVVRSKNLTLEQAYEVMTHPSRDVRIMLTHNRFLPSFFLEEYAKYLMEENNEDLLDYLIRNENLAMKIVREICTKFPSCVTQGILNGKIDEDTLEFIYNNISLDKIAKKFLYNNEKCPSWILKDVFMKEDDLKNKRDILNHIKSRKMVDLYKELSLLLLEIECSEMYKNLI